MKVCPKCKAIHDKNGVFCSRACANSRGPRTDEFKSIVSDKLKGVHRPERMGDNNCNRKGRNLPPILDKECLSCGSVFRPYNRAAQYCCNKCRHDHILHMKNDWQKYSIACRFKFNVYDYPDWFELSLINEFGWYTASNKGNNINGISRDHMISVKYGFLHSISSEIISHQANCKLMKHTENSSKYTKSSITLEELVDRIETFNIRVAERSNALDCKSNFTSVRI